MITDINMSSSGRNRISDGQRNVLEAMYNAGMVGSSLLYKTKIDKVVEETGLTTSQVKVSLLNVSVINIK